jgi:beta-carotene ketolase (CrtO type)
VDALVRCLEAAGGRIETRSAAERVEVVDGRAVAVRAAGRRIDVRKAVISALDARRLFGSLVDLADVPAGVRGELDRIHVGRRNVSELKVDAVVDAVPEITPGGFERAFMLSPNTLGDIERAFASIALGRLPERPTLMIAFPSVLEPGWAPRGKGVIWISTFVPWLPADGAWGESLLERAAEHAWAAAERALGARISVVDRRLTGPLDWVGRTGNPHANPNHIEMSIDQLLSFRPAPSLSGYRTPIANLFLTGAGTHPGGGITGIPGRNTAAVVLEQLHHRRRKPARAFTERAARLRDFARAARTLRAAL